MICRRPLFGRFEYLLHTCHCVIENKLRNQNIMVSGYETGTWSCSMTMEKCRSRRRMFCRSLGSSCFGWRFSEKRFFCWHISGMFSTRLSLLNGHVRNILKNLLAGLYRDIFNANGIKGITQDYDVIISRLIGLNRGNRFLYGQS